jgi:hypothetical protein
MDARRPPRGRSRRLGGRRGAAAARRNGLTCASGPCVGGGPVQLGAARVAGMVCRLLRWGQDIKMPGQEGACEASGCPAGSSRFRVHGAPAPRRRRWGGASALPGRISKPHQQAAAASAGRLRQGLRQLNQASAAAGLARGARRKSADGRGAGPAGTLWFGCLGHDPVADSDSGSEHRRQRAITLPRADAAKTAATARLGQAAPTEEAPSISGTSQPPSIK